MAEDAGFVVVDIWKSKAGLEQELQAVLTRAGRLFRSMDGVVSVDYTRFVDDESRYLVVFRYRDSAARNVFVQTDELRDTMKRLEALWDLESPIYQGIATGF